MKTASNLFFYVSFSFLFIFSTPQAIAEDIAESFTDQFIAPLPIPSSTFPSDNLTTNNLTTKPSANSSSDPLRAAPNQEYRAKISIIIDDLGYQYAPAQTLTDLPYALTLAIIPFTPYSTAIAKLAQSKHKEVMLHAPMEALGPDQWEKGLTSTMNEHETIITLESMLKNVPYAKGVNNHGGSKLTQNQEHMDWLMKFLASKELYFIDSRTIASTVAASSAKSTGIAFSERDVFLDNVKSVDLIRIQIEKLLALALKQGHAIGIGHPYPETLESLAKELPKLQQSGIQLVNISELIQTTYSETQIFDKSLSFQPLRDAQ